MTDPVCPLVLALYGHPLSGTFWENYYSEIAMTCGFEPVQGWECLYVHRGLQIFLSVYVDDFKMAGLTRNLPSAWKLLIDAGLILDPPEPLGLYLGCAQHPVTLTQNEVNARLTNIRPLYPRSGDGPPENYKRLAEVIPKHSTTMFRVRRKRFSENHLRQSLTRHNMALRAYAMKWQTVVTSA